MHSHCPSTTTAVPPILHCCCANSFWHHSQYMPCSLQSYACCEQAFSPQHRTMLRYVRSNCCIIYLASAPLTMLLYSLKDRQWEGRQHSPAQEEARQRAADELVNQQYSWLGPLAGMFAKNMQQGSSSVHNDEGLGRNQVGRRKRAPAAAAAAKAQQQATIPVERSLVLISKRDE